MFDIALLQVLKYLGFAVTAASVIWGVIAKTRFEDAAGNKRLTAAGQISIGLAIAGFLVGAGAYGVEQSINASEKTRKQSADDLERARNLAFQERQERSTEETRAWNQRFEELQKASAAADRLADRLLISGQSVARRDILLTRQITELRAAGIDRRIQEGTRANLGRTDTALGEIDRLQNPISDVRIEVTWEIQGTPALNRLLIETLESAVASPGAPSPPATGALLCGVVGLGASAREACGRVPDNQLHANVAALFLRGTDILFDIDGASDRDITLLLSGEGPNRPFNDQVFELRFHVPMERERLRLVTLGADGNFLVPTEPMVVTIGTLGRINSIPDLERSRLIVVPRWRVLSFDPPAGVRMLPYKVVIFVAGRRYTISKEAFRQVGRAFIAESIGSAF